MCLGVGCLRRFITVTATVIPRADRHANSSIQTALTRQSMITLPYGARHSRRAPARAHHPTPPRVPAPPGPATSARAPRHLTADGTRRGAANAALRSRCQSMRCRLRAQNIVGPRTTAPSPLSVAGSRVLRDGGKGGGLRAAFRKDGDARSMRPEASILAAHAGQPAGARACAPDKELHEGTLRLRHMRA